MTVVKKAEFKIKNSYSGESKKTIILAALDACGCTGNAPCIEPTPYGE